MTLLGSGSRSYEIFIVVLCVAVHQRISALPEMSKLSSGGGGGGGGRNGLFYVRSVKEYTTTVNTYEWFTATGLIKELIELIGSYCVVTDRFWDRNRSVSEEEVDLLPPLPANTTHEIVARDETAESVQFVCGSLHTAQTWLWRRVWGSQPMGVGTPYFAVRVERCDQNAWICIGLSATPNLPREANPVYGSSESTWTVVGAESISAFQSVGDLQPLKGGRFMVAISHSAMRSDVLSTLSVSSSPELKDLSPGAQFQQIQRHPNAGFATGTTVGVVCDLSRNSIVWYVDDQIVRSTQIVLPSNLQSKVAERIDSKAGGGEAFVWHPVNYETAQPVNVSNLFPYICTFGAPVIVKMANSWIPPPLPPPPPPPPATGTGTGTGTGNTYQPTLSTLPTATAIDFSSDKKSSPAASAVTTPASTATPTKRKNKNKKKK